MRQKDFWTNELFKYKKDLGLRTNADRGLFSLHTYYSADFPYWQKK